MKQYFAKLGEQLSEDGFEPQQPSAAIVAAKDDELTISAKEFAAEVAKMIMTRKGHVIDESVAKERGNNIAAAFQGYTIK